MKENGGVGVSRVAVAADTERAFDALLRRQRRPLRRIAKNASARAGVEADDVEQELLLRAWRQRAKLVHLHEDDLCDWSRAHGVYAARDVRRNSLIAELMAQVPEDTLVERDAFDLAADNDSARRLLTGLSPEARAIIWARAMTDATFREIGEHFGISEESARQQYLRARHSIRMREDAHRALGLILLPLRAFLPSRKARIFGLPWAPAALTTLMIPLLALRVTEPFSPIRNRPDQGTVPVEWVPVDPVSRIRTAPTATNAMPSHGAKLPAKVPTKPRPQETTLPDAKAKGCVNGICASTGDNDDPGDDVYVNLPGPIGRKNVKQNAVPACDVVPDLPPYGGCERTQ